MTKTERCMGTVQFMFMFHMILLLWLIQAAVALEEPSKSRCTEQCGNITIQSPFGIVPGCYQNSWFRVICNETAGGKKPFISRINLELLGSYSDSEVIVNSPAVTYHNCSKYVNKGNGVNLTGSPFFFSSRSNDFGSIGCGNLVTLLRNKTSIAGCVQPRCGNLLTNTGCSIRLFENLTSFPETILQVPYYGKEEGSKGCSTFIFERGHLQNINFSSTHIPATLGWTSPVECDLEAAQCQQAGATSNYKPNNCTERCGNVEIAYPFGIEPRCYMNDWFRVTCNKTADGRKRPFISKIGLQLVSFSFLDGIVRVNHPVTYSNCRYNDNNGGVSVDLTGSPFYFSNDYNIFISVGCGSLATLPRNQTDHVIGGCVQPSCGSNNLISRAGSCLTMVPPGISSFIANLTENRNGGNRSCGSAFMIDHDYARENIWDSHGMIVDPQLISRRAHFLTSLGWATIKAGLCELTQGSQINCSSDGDYCWSRLSSRHLCVCSKSVRLISLSTDICEELGKCDGPYRTNRLCHMLCLNGPDDYCLNSSACPDGYVYHNIRDRCEPILPDSTQQYPARKPENWAIIIGCSTGFGTLFLMLGAWHLYEMVKARRNIKLRRKYFKRNGGLLLQQQLSRNEGSSISENIWFFTSKELEKATDYYNQNRILGKGGQGIVYKGMLADGRIVAVKKPKIGDDKKKIFLDGKQLEQWINEVMILSQINHRNVVKLLGCCLETHFPLLVYEFIPNGALYQMIHEQSEEFPLTWEMRLRIGIEVANALSYLHSAASLPIYHRDIKSSNILLDDKYRAKVSDFGTSRSIELEQTHLTTRVQGTFGYLDPEYFRSNQFTDKSDVYSFGVVLVELITGKKPVCFVQSEDEDSESLVALFLLAMKKNSLFDILDRRVINDGRHEEEIVAVAKLAKRCLNINGNKRPTMKQVAMELESVRAASEDNSVQRISDVDEDSEDNRNERRTSASCSTSSNVKEYSITASLLVSNTI